MALLALFWTVEGNHLKVINVATQVEDVVAEAVVPPDLDDALRIVLGALLVNTMIFTGGPGTRSIARLRELGPGSTERVAAQTTVLLALAEALPPGESTRSGGSLRPPRPAGGADGPAVGQPGPREHR